MKSIIVKCSGVGGQFFIFFALFFKVGNTNFFHYKKSIKVNEFEFLFHCEKKIIWNIGFFFVIHHVFHHCKLCKSFI